MTTSAEATDRKFLDVLVGLDIRACGAAERILSLCRQRLADIYADCVFLHFSDDLESYADEIMVERDDSVGDLVAKLGRIASRGLTTIRSHAS